MTAPTPLDQALPATSGTDEPPDLRPPSSWKLVWRDRRARAGAVVILLFALVALLAPLIAPYHPLERLVGPDGDLLRLQPPSLEHPFGTSNYGRDLFSQAIWGTRRTLQVGVIAAVVAVVIGTNIGLIAGFAGGWVEQVLMRLNDAALALPFVPLAIVLIGTLGRSDVVLIIAIALVFWRIPARVVRAEVLVLKELGFVRAATCGGATRRRILYRQIAPNILPYAFLYGMLLTAEAVIAEATLSFLGFAPRDALSLGTIMFDAFSSQQIRQAWWWPLFPGLMIMAFVVAVSLLSEAYERLLSLEGVDR
ncbi:ABC transporter permease [Phytoactinopolyspora alkaliphila]|uniref:ABC transporter permease n=1 Tax=Phytoactinopolyspora alkaliphila TaxID=1783498 RepID=A0A6N9YNH0_9ACTN|nr:ABC transporter permease [Phytoactinopolyspora alkaliphila]NED96379.1 ABC transporter permease [Phytoactinopolyspora alkaliphila]